MLVARMRIVTRNVDSLKARPFDVGRTAAEARIAARRTG
jgi:hypothetical protein